MHFDIDLNKIGHALNEALSKAFTQNTKVCVADNTSGTINPILSTCITNMLRNNLPV